MKLVKIILFILLSGCSMFDTSNIAPGYVEAFKNISSLFKEKVNPNITRDIVTAIPYASSILTVGKGMPGLIILSDLTDTKETWISADNIYIVSSKGKIIKTSGLINNVTRSTLPQISFKDLEEGEIYNYVYYLSYDKPFLNDLKLDVRIAKKGKEEIIILGIKRELTLVEENLENKILGWKVKNSYWIDQKGFIWKSIQNLSPKLPAFTIEVTKKPAI